MAALDFGMAFARGMLPTSEKAQKDLLNLAGGRNIFKSEDWWNTQVDKQIAEGYRQKETQTQFLVDTGLAMSGITPQKSYIQEYRAGVRDMYGILRPPKGAVRAPSAPIVGTPKFYSRSVTGFDLGDRKDFTAGELSNIEASAKSGAKRARRETAQAETSRKRLTRGTGGLAAKARPVGAKATTGLPELGTGGLQLGTTSLGKGLLV